MDAPSIIVFDINETLMDIESIGLFFREEIRQSEGTSRMVQSVDPVSQRDHSVWVSASH
jgi:hypothetical protein